MLEEVAGGSATLTTPLAAAPCMVQVKVPATAAAVLVERICALAE